MAGGTKEQRAAVRTYAQELGLAFQIRDDMLDAGESAGADASKEKDTYANLLGIEECSRLVEQHTAAAKNALNSFEMNGFLGWLADLLAGRRL